MSTETSHARADRQRRRMTFDSIADEYDTIRPTYPKETTDLLIEVSGISRHGRVLEIGCGTGQLTKDLVTRGLEVVAIDPGPALIDKARERLDGLPVDLRVSTFEDLDEAPDSFNLVVSASAFHWIDPDVRWTKTASLLRAGGWVALIDTVLKHEEWLRDAIMDLWIAHSDDGGEWAKKPAPSLVDTMRSSGLFGPIVSETHGDTTTMRGEEVVGLAKTAGAFLAYSPERKESFVHRLSEALRDHPAVKVELGASLTMAPLS